MMSLSFKISCRLLVAAVYTITAVQAQQPVAHIDNAVYQFRSRPDLYPARLNVTINGPDVTPGYLFLAPYQTVQNTGLIYDTNGNLIFSGFGLTGVGNTHDFRPCSYNGSDHLCFYQGTQYLGYARGQGSIMDNSMHIVSSVRGGGGRAGLDQHEMHVVDGSTAYVTIYQPKPYDLSHYNITDGQGWIQDSMFQQIDLETGNVLFEWSAIEHVALAEGYVGMGESEVAGSGFNATSPWDYFHINSIDRNSDGDFLISARHTSTLYKISGQDGHIIWRCGGKLSDFDIEQGLNWTFQHHARWQSNNASTDIISLFDNASNGFLYSANHSAGLIIKIDHSANPPMVTLVKRFSQPEDIPISDSQGDVQILNTDDWANSKVFISWGSSPCVSEYDPDGNVIYQACFTFNGMMHYRGYKYNFTSNPRDDPALWTYAQNTNSSTHYYMSWNGATELRQWRIYGRSSCDGDWTRVATVDKGNFETLYEAPQYYEYGMVEALGPDGKGLRNSTSRGVKAFVPTSALASVCNADGCDTATTYNDQGVALDQADETVSACAFSSVKQSTPTSSGSSSATSTNAAAAVVNGHVRGEWLAVGSVMMALVM